MHEGGGSRVGSNKLVELKKKKNFFYGPQILALYYTKKVESQEIPGVTEKFGLGVQT